MWIMSHKVALSLTYVSIPMCRILNRDELLFYILQSGFFDFIKVQVKRMKDLISLRYRCNCTESYIRFLAFNSSVRFLHKLLKNS